MRAQSFLPRGSCSTAYDSGASSDSVLITLAGTPPTNEFGGTDLVTTAPAATIEPRPIVTPGKTVTSVISTAPSSIVTGRTSTLNVERSDAGPSSCWVVKMRTKGASPTPLPMLIGPSTPSVQNGATFEPAPIERLAPLLCTVPYRFKRP